MCRALEPQVEVVETGQEEGIITGGQRNAIAEGNGNDEGVNDDGDNEHVSTPTCSMPFVSNAELEKDADRLDQPSYTVSVTVFLRRLQSTSVYLCNFHE